MNPLLGKALAGLAFAGMMLTGVLPAYADEGTPMTPKQSFEHADVDQNGSVDVEEFRARHIEIFVLMDANGDGFVVLAEVPDEHKGKFEAVDEDKDGRVDLHEYLVFVMPAFWLEYDTNKDNLLSLDEVEAAAARKQ